MNKGEIVKVFLMFFIMITCWPVFTTGQQAMIEKPVVNGIYFNEDFIGSLNRQLDIENPKTIFNFVFTGLKDEIKVLPTENYYYFQFYASGKWYWGNFRLDREDRDKGIIHFAYYEYIDDPQSPDEGYFQYQPLGFGDGVLVKKTDQLQYEVAYNGKTVRFLLNDLDQTPPAQLIRFKTEVFINRTQDESGFTFLLIFNRKDRNFMWILDESQTRSANFEFIDTRLLLDKLSGFVFYLDKSCHNRKILVGVSAQNIRRNNYWDGPFDQLADNFIHPDFKKIIGKVYKSLKGKVDEYGKYLFEDGSRLAITPYHEYESLDELKQSVFECETDFPQKKYPCLTYDMKVDF